MSCARCGHENRSGAKFCEQCAAPLLMEAKKLLTELS
jgi:uncharacterized membrane protein YvbJ